MSLKHLDKLTVSYERMLKTVLYNALLIRTYIYSEEKSVFYNKLALNSEIEVLGVIIDFGLRIDI